MTPSEQVLKALKSGPKPGREIMKLCTWKETSIQTAITRLRRRGSITGVKHGNALVYSLATTDRQVDVGTTARDGLKAACAVHPELAEILLETVSPPEPVDKRHRVRRTPTTGKFLRTG